MKVLAINYTYFGYLAKILQYVVHIHDLSHLI